jgi:hypothetical protein
VFENGVMRRIFETKREEEAKGWRKLHNEKLHNSYTSPDIVRVIRSTWMKWAEHVSRMREMENAYSTSVEEPEEKR